MPTQRRYKRLEAFVTGVQRVITGIQLLALGVVDAQIKRIALNLFIRLGTARTEVFKGF